MRAVVLQPHGEREGQFARRVHRAEHHVGERVSRLGTRKPRLQHRRNAADPRHRHGVARDDHHRQIGIGFGQRPDHFVLRIRQAVLQAVVAFAVLVVALVQAPDEDHRVGLAGRSHGIGDQLRLGTALAQILPGLHPVVVARHVADVTAFVDHFGFTGRSGADAFERRIFVPHLERRGAAAHGHHLDSVLTHDSDGLRPPEVDGQHPALVFQQHDALAGDTARSGQVFGRIERPERFAGVHRRAENQPQHPARLVVERRHRSLALAEHIEVGGGEVVVVVGVAGSPAQAVGPRTELHVETVLGGLLRVVRAAPVGDDHAVEGPVAFQNVVQQIPVVTAMLSLIFIIGAHDGPCTALLDSCLEGREVDFVQRTVVDRDIDAVAVRLLIIEREMLHADGNAVLLHLLDVGNDHPRGEVGILAHVLEIAAVERRAVDVHAGSQQDVLLAVARLLADGFAIQRRHFGVPRRGEARQRRESRAGVVGPAGLIPFVPQDLGTDAVGTVGAPHLGNAQARNARRREFRLRVQDGDLLFEGHARKSVLDPSFDGLRFVEVDGDAALRPRPAPAGDSRGRTERSEAFYPCSVLHFGKKICCVCKRSAQSRGRALRDAKLTIIS